MNKIKYILATLSLLFVFDGCREDDKLIFNPKNVSPGQLASINASYVLEATKAAEIAQVFSWGVFDMGYNAAVTYSLEMDLAGNNFANAVELASGNTLTVSITVGQLNAAMLRLKRVYDFEDASEQNVGFRVMGSISPNVEPFYTNVVSTKITPYSASVDYPKIWVIGDFCGWNHGRSQFLYAFTGGDLYEGLIFFDDKAANGFKITGEANWNNGNWGLPDGDTPPAEASSITLWDDGGSKDIKCYSKNFYVFSYNTSSLELKMLNSMNTFGIIGDGANGWGDDDDIPFDFDTQNQVFVATVTLTDGSIKFRADQAWNYNLGQKSGAETGIMAKDGDNISIVAGTYKITVNLNNSDEMTYKIEAATALDPNLIIAQVLNDHDGLEMYQNKSDEISWTALDFGGQEPATVNYTVEMALQGTDFSNIQILGTTKETSLTVSGDTYLEALEALGKEIDEAVDVEIRVTATVSGITNTFTSNVISFNLTVMTPPQYPAELYMTGSEFGSWFSDQSGVVKMIPVNGTPGSFWCIKYFHEGVPFKWAPQPAWEGGDFAELDVVTGYTVSEGNAVLDEDGLYMVYIDMSAKEITIEPAKVYGMGSCFGGWDSGVYLFDVDDCTASFVTTGAGELRMYAGSSASTATTDWWRMEFIILDGNIVYRGNGDDQKRVTVAAGQTVILDFKAETGQITGEPIILYPENLYVIGSFAGWDWKSDDVITMIPVRENPNAFWAITHFDADTEFKFSPVKDWAGDFGVSGTATDGIYDKGTGNISVETDGYYLIYVDLEEEKIFVGEPSVYLIGDCSKDGKWDTGVADNLFAVDATGLTATTFGAGDLRMYATCPLAAEIGWWQTEFNIFDGKIVFRGKGGDQAAVPAGAGKTVTLEFKDGTGTIEE